MRRKKILILTILAVGILVTGYLSLDQGFSKVAESLSLSRPVNANILVVEGWLTGEAIDSASNIFRDGNYKYLVTTGLMPEADYFKVSMNGYLIFYPGRRFDRLTESGSHIIEISAYSEVEGENCSHFNFFVNDSLVSDFKADKSKQQFAVRWYGKLEKVDSLMVQFDNDAMGDFGDRNLYVKEITIDSAITISAMNNTEYAIDKIYGRSRVINNYDSHAGWARERLIEAGVDPSLIVALPCRRTKMNRTLTSALEVHEWLKNGGTGAEGINVISSGIHSRRTWMIYRKILKSYCNVGIVSLPDYNRTYIGKHQKRKTLREALAITYYSVLLLPYQLGLW